jgi:hypothetical protein
MMTPSSMKKAPNDVKPTCHHQSLVSHGSAVQLDPKWAAAVARTKRVIEVAG